LTAEVACVSGTAGIAGRGIDFSGFPLVDLDTAHDLSWRGPCGYIYPEGGNNRDGVTLWRVSVVGFIEAEARAAFRSVCAAIR